MLGIVGIMGCVVIAATCVAAGAAVVGMGFAIKGSQDAKDAAKEQEKLLNEANKKAEDRSKANEVLQDRITAKNLLRARQQVGDSIAYSKLMTERTQRKAARERHEAAAEKVQNAKHYAHGKPVA